MSREIEILLSLLTETLGRNLVTENDFYSLRATWNQLGKALQRLEATKLGLDPEERKRLINAFLDRATKDITPES